MIGLYEYQQSKNEDLNDEIAKLEKKSKSVGDAKKSTYQKLEENRIDEEDLV